MKEKWRHRTKESNRQSQKMRKSQGLDSRASQGLWLDHVGPFVFGQKLHKEDYNPNFFQTLVAQATKELDSGASKETKNNCEKGQCNTNKTKEVTT
jgi:hypothetical protein